MMQCLQVLCVLFVLTCTRADHTRLAMIARQVSTFLSTSFMDNVTSTHQNLSSPPAVNGTFLVSQLAKDLESKLALVQSLLQGSLAVAEEAYLNRFHSNYCVCLNATMTTECVGEGNSTLFYQTSVNMLTSWSSEVNSPNREELEYSKPFHRNVSFRVSAVHVPVDIYIGDPELVCFIDWTDNLTRHFQEQRQFLPDQFTYQYFAGILGATRIFPATEWTILNNCKRCPLPPTDTFDARQRPWFTNTVSGNKFVAIVLDLSGSMSGFRLLLMQLAVQQLLQTLTPNDFFFVVGTKLSGLSYQLCCSQNRTRATPENILAINDVITELTISDLGEVADFSTSIQLVFQQLNSGVETCHNVIAVFTDRDSDQTLLATVLDKFNANKQMRVFPYLVGRPSNDSMSKLQKIACNHGGNLYCIEDYSDIIDKIVSFNSYLRKLVPSERSRDKVFWSHYRDLFGDYVLTGSLPLIIDDGQGSSEFLGVMAMDINLHMAEEQLNAGLSPGMYGFVMDNNGELVIHPEIQSDIIADLSADELLTLDVGNFEHAVNRSDFEEFRKAMIARGTGEFTLSSWIPIKRETRYVLRTVTDYYTPVPESPFTMALVNITHLQVLCTPGLPCQQTGYVHYLQQVQTDGIYLYSDEDKVVAIRGFAPPMPHPPTLYGIVLTIEAGFLGNLAAFTQTGDETRTVYLLDSNGFIVTSSSTEDAPGTHLSFALPDLLSDLVTQDVYIKGDIQGYELRPCSVWFNEQSSCVDNAGHSIYQGVVNSVCHWLLHMLSGGMWLLAKSMTTSLLASILRYTGVSGQDSMTLAGMMSFNETCGATCPVNLCLVKFVPYELRAGFSDVENGTVSCADNTTSILYDAISVVGTNLLVVWVTGRCDGNQTHTATSHSVAVQCVCDCGSCEGYREDVAMDTACYSNRSVETSSCSSGSLPSIHTPLPIRTLSLMTIFSALLHQTTM